MRIQYKETAIADIRETEKYIVDVLQNKTAARRLTARIADAISLLRDNPYMGTPLNGKVNTDTDLRYLVVSKQIIFYRVKDGYVEVTRVLDGRQDYIAILF